jgi:AcrR family transcriptional regulator
LQKLGRSSRGRSGRIDTTGGEARALIGLRRVPEDVVVGAREQMVDVAERLAAERGLAAMSLREVQSLAGQRNKSAAQYHFGSRAGLIEAVVATRMGPINDERARRLADLDDQEREPDVRELVEVLVEPLAEATTRTGSCWARFLAQGLNDPELSSAVRRRFEGRAYRDVRRRLVAALDQLPEELRASRVDHAVGLLVTSLAAAEVHAAAGGARWLPVAVRIADLVDICTAVLVAPASTATTAALARRGRRSA